MNEIKESAENKIPEKPTKTDLPKISEDSQWRDQNPRETPKVYTDVFKTLGLVSDKSENASETSVSADNETNENDENPYSDYLEKGEDGKFYDKETGKSYDSIDDWKKDLQTLLKKYESTAEYCEKKAAKEWAKYKNADQNGESEAAKWNHKKMAQEHYDRAKVCREKAEIIKQKLGISNESAPDKSNESSDSGNGEKSDDSSDDLKSGGTSEQKEIQTRELTEKEKNELREKLGWTDAQISKCTIDESGVIHYKTDCSYMEGKETEGGVKYERKTVDIHGIKVEGVFPVFDSAFDIQLPEDMEKSSNTKQFNECNRQLREAVKNDPELRKKFTYEQLEDIENGDIPMGYVWHHNEETGKMQLVKIEDHNKTQGGAAHTGGKALWGGGYYTTQTNNS